MHSSPLWNGHVNVLKLVLTLIQNPKALHNAEQMLPHLEHITLPDPLPNMKSMNVICYDFVPQLLSILQNPKMMVGNNLLLDKNNPLAMYKPPDIRLGEALSGSVYQDM
jgi:hypothetical protein